MYCHEDVPRMSCSENSWKIKLKAGSYIVRIVIGDLKYQTQYDIQFNGVPVIDGKILKKD